MKVLYGDFEFNRIVEPNLNLVCAVTLDPLEMCTRKWWLHNDPAKQKELKLYIKSFDKFVAFSAIAEARSLMTLGLNPLSFKWEDLFLEYRCITNHNDALLYGEQLVDGVKRTVKKPKPKWERTEEDNASPGFRPTHSLAEATFKILGLIRDTKNKDKMRDLIISDPKEFSPSDQEAILNYCEEDVVSLPEMREKIIGHFLAKDIKLKREQLEIESEWRGRYAAHTAIMEHKGYPIDVDKTWNFSHKVGSILFDCQREINELFPSIKPFKWNKKENRFSWDQTATRAWIEKTFKGKNWMLTDKGDLSLSEEAWTRYFDFKHDYPKDNFGAQIVRYLKLKKNLFGFQQGENKNKKSFWDSVGSDGRVRPYLNIYGAQSSRSQPGSTGFMFLKPAWMRALVIPKPGKFMAGIDYGSEEFFISALESGDANMINAYLTGDVYLAFYKLAGVIPANATKETHKKERELAKRTVLGISYNMSKYGLAIHLTADSGETWTEDDAQEQIDLFEETFADFTEYRLQIQEKYKTNGFIKLDDGWYMWNGNDNHRSVGNVPIQGMGAVIMRKAVDLAVSKGIYIPFTLHDALYMEDDIGNEWKIKVLRDCMIEAFAFYYKDDPKKFEFAKQIKLDPFAWSKDYEKDSELDLEGYKVPCSNLYIDERSKADYFAFSKYFVDSPSDLL